VITSVVIYNSFRLFPHSDCYPVEELANLQYAVSLCPDCENLYGTNNVCSYLFNANDACFPKSFTMVFVKITGAFIGYSGVCC